MDSVFMGTYAVGRAFLVTFFGYFMAHFSRKCYSTVKLNLVNEAGYSAFLIGAMDSVFMGTYAVGNIVSGNLGDRFRPTNILAVGLFGSGVCLFFITIGLIYDFEGMNAQLGNFFHSILLLLIWIFPIYWGTGWNCCYR